jgi:3-hydroxybutyryl-CoA dehydrogenase
VTPRVPPGSAVGVVGAGTMGAGIAQVAAQAGHRVLVYDAREGAATAAVDGIADRLARLVERGRLPGSQADQATRRLCPVGSIDGFADCILVVEAIVEDLAEKQRLFAELERVCAAEAVLATNTSTISIDAIGEALQHGQRVCGMHFFNPAPVMRLVEVPAADATDPQVAQTIAATATEWGKTPVHCASTPGFIVNRVARPFYGEAQRILEEGVADCAAIDAAMRAEGFRMGPFELADLIGNDVNLAATVSVWEQTGRDPRYQPTRSQRQLVEQGRLGRKTGRGWYDQLDPPVVEPVADERVSGRILAMLVNEAAALVDRGEAAPADVDTAMRLGTNYPKGPLEWGDQLGAGRVAELLTDLARRDPSGRYRLSERLARVAASGGSLRD